MRRLSMKNRRRKSETSSSELEENGGTRASISEGNSQSLNKSNKSIESRGDTPTSRKSAAARRSRSTTMRKTPLDDASESHDENPDSDEQENGVAKSTPSKRRKKEEQKASSSARDKSRDNDEDDDEYEVEKITGQRTIKGRRQFLVRWKGYGDAADSWENEKDLNCPQLIENFIADEEDNKEAAAIAAAAARVKSPKAKVAKTDKTRKSKDEQSKENTMKEKETLKEFEVEKILEVHFKKNGTKEFLIRWKGFGSSDDSWEPEKNLNCPELINKFMRKLEKVKTSEFRELRTNPKHTKRYTLTTHEPGRRLSRRNIDKQRTTYHECYE